MNETAVDKPGHEGLKKDVWLDPGKSSPHNRRMNLDLRQLYHALGDLIAITNRPQPGLALMREAGISLDRALFVLLVRIERRGPIGIVELAEVSARDYTTVSRQVNKLESL